MTAPVHGLYLPDAAARDAIIAEARDDVRRGESIRDEAYSQLRELGIAVPETFELEFSAGHVGVSFPADLTPEQKREACEVAIGHLHDYKRGVL